MLRPAVLLRSGVTALALCAFSAAQELTPATRSFPFTPLRVEAGEVELETELAPLRELAALDAVLLDGVVDAYGRMVRLVLRRADLRFEPGAVHVDGVAQAEALPEGTTLWSGNVVGEAEHTAFLALSPFGTRGWFEVRGERHHLLAEPTVGDWSRARLRVLSEARLAALGTPELAFGCEVLPTPGRARGERGRGARGGVPEGGTPTPIYSAPIVFETTYEYTAGFGNLDAARTYIAALIGAIAEVYRREVGVVFTIPYLGFHTTNTDPWNPASCFDMNLQFQATWGGGRAPARGVLYHLITRTNCGGGIAYLNALCNRDFAFGVSGGVTGQTPLPPGQGPLTWDFVVVAHELGHGFGAIHTHAYEPPVDNCGNGNCASPAGTLMSYCHTCPGGMSNIALSFHAQSAADMRALVEGSCLRAATAPNDECATALLLRDGRNGPFHNGVATDSQPAWACGSGTSGDLWFRYTAYCTGTLTLDTCVPGTDFDTRLELFSGACGALVSLGCSDNACGQGNRYARLQVPVSQDEVYLVRVGGTSGATGNFALELSCDGIREHDYAVTWKYATKPDKTSALLPLKGTTTGACNLNAAGTYAAPPITAGTFARDSRGKILPNVAQADLQQVLDDLYGAGNAPIDSVVSAVAKLTQTFGKNGRPGKVKYSLKAQVIVGGKLLKFTVGFGGVEV
jgi:hypothetical protein